METYVGCPLLYVTYLCASSFFHMACFESDDLKVLLNQAFLVRVSCQPPASWQCCAPFQWHHTGAQCYAKGWRYPPSGKLSPNRNCSVDMNIKMILKRRELHQKRLQIKTTPWLTLSAVCGCVLYKRMRDSCPLLELSVIHGTVL